MISLRSLSIHYAGHQVVTDLSAEIESGSIVLVAGASGSGKTSLLQTLAGLTPAFTQAQFFGNIVVDHEPLSTSRADKIAYVPQSPSDSFVAEIVEDEIAFNLETHGWSRADMLERIDEICDLLGITPLRKASTAKLSTGQQQKVAIAAALAARPSILLLDEPTSALDPQTVSSFMSVFQNISHLTQTTIIIAEHRIERVLEICDSVIVLMPDTPAEFLPHSIALAHLPHKPAIVELAQLAGVSTANSGQPALAAIHEPLLTKLAQHEPPLRLIAQESAPLISVENLSAGYTSHEVISRINCTIHPGHVTAVVGPNGAGKSTLLLSLMDETKVFDGKIHSTQHLRRGFVPQQPSDLFMSHTVFAECRENDELQNLPKGKTRATLALLSPDIEDSIHPRDLSEGQKLALALALTLSGKPDVLLLDEPTRGLDAAGRLTLIQQLELCAESGIAVVIATHDRELAAVLSHEIIVLENGQITASGPAHEIMATFAEYQSTTAQVLAPSGWLSLQDVKSALAN